MIPSVFMNLGFAAGEAATIPTVEVAANRQSYAAIYRRSYRLWWFLPFVLERLIRHGR